MRVRLDRDTLRWYKIYLIACECELASKRENETCILTISLYLTMLLSLRKEIESFPATVIISYRYMLLGFVFSSQMGSVLS